MKPLPDHVDDRRQADQRHRSGTRICCSSHPERADTLIAAYQSQRLDDLRLVQGRLNGKRLGGHHNQITLRGLHRLPSFSWPYVPPDGRRPKGDARRNAEGSLQHRDRPLLPPTAARLASAADDGVLKVRDLAAARAVQRRRCCQPHESVALYARRQDIGGTRRAEQRAGPRDAVTASRSLRLPLQTCPAARPHSTFRRTGK